MGLNLTGNLSPYIALLLIDFLLHCFHFKPSTVDDITINICVCMKINGVTSSGTQNKSHTTYLYLPSIILYVTYTINKHKFYTYYTSV